MNPGIQIKREEDHGVGVALLVRTLQGYETRAQEPSQFIPESISQEDLKITKNETEMLTDILKKQRNYKLLH